MAATGNAGGDAAMLEVAHVSKSFGALRALSDVSLQVGSGSIVGLIGPNGAGKTTLLRLLLGRLEPMAGHAQLGANVDVAEFAQHQVDALDFDRTVLEELRRAVGDEHGRNLRSVLAAFGFKGDAVDRTVADLSGGERTRLALARIMVEPVNLLVLDTEVYSNTGGQQSKATPIDMPKASRAFMPEE